MPLNPLHPQQLLLLGMLTLLALFLVVTVAASELGALDLSLGNGVEEAAAVPSAPAPAEPDWTRDPLTPPIETLRGR